MQGRILVVLAALGLAGAGLGCSETEATAPVPPAPPEIEVGARPVEAVGAVLERLGAISELDTWIERAFEARVRREPEWASSLGLRERFPDASAWLDDVSPAYLEATHQLELGLLAQLRAFDAAALTERQALVRQVMIRFLEDRERLHPFAQHEYAVTHFITGAQVQLAITFQDLHPFETVEDAERYLLRLRQVRSKLSQVGQTLRERAAAGFVLPSRLLEYAIGRTASYIPATVTASEFYRTFTNGTARLEQQGLLTTDRRVELLQVVRILLVDQVFPAYVALGSTLVDLRSSAPDEVGVGRLPDGAAYYAAALRHHTTTDLSADEIHQLGLDLLRTIDVEMRDRFEALGQDRTQPLQALFAAAAQASGAVSGSAIVQEYERILREAEAKLPEAFETLPQAAWRVIGGPTGGFYISASLDGTRPGAFYAQNTGSVARFGMPTLAYHEVIPGHHLQIALAQELDLPLFSNVVNFTAATEGWALYAERLASELGWYDGDPYGDLGRLQYEAFRAARLVVDTGMHAKGWSFERAQTFFAQATGFSTGAAEGQIARYAAWPGQATAYMVGMQEILRLRERARAELGDRFDLRAFHSRVLEDGALPLELLEAKIDGWISTP